MLSDEEKKAIESLIEIREFANLSSYKDTKISQLNAIDVVLNLIEKQSKEIEELNKENLEIRDWKYVIDSPIDLDKLKELDLIKIKGKEYVSKDKIKAKIEELDLAVFKNQTIYTVNKMQEIKFARLCLAELLEKE